MHLPGKTAVPGTLAHRCILEGRGACCATSACVRREQYAHVHAAVTVVILLRPMQQGMENWLKGG